MPPVSLSVSGRSTLGMDLFLHWKCPMLYTYVFLCFPWTGVCARGGHVRLHLDMAPSWSFLTLYYHCADQATKYSDQTHWVPSPALPLVVNCVTSGQLSKFSEPQFCHLSHWDDLSWWGYNNEGFRDCKSTLWGVGNQSLYPSSSFSTLALVRALLSDASGKRWGLWTNTGRAATELGLWGYMQTRVQKGGVVFFKMPVYFFFIVSMNW